MYYKELNKKGVTCLKCYKTYILNNENKLIKNILSEHIIHDEEGILNKIKCNICKNIYKKEITLCNSCKYVNECKPIVTEIPSNKPGEETIKTFASGTFNKINYYSNIYDVALNEGIDVYTMKPLVEFIKKNNLLKEKQPNVIIRKILRCRSILSIYKESKYINIQNVIKRIYININYISKLDDYQFCSLKNILINILDKELKNNKNIENEKNNRLEDQYELNNNINKDQCIKCLNYLSKKEDITYCNNCIKLCIIPECKRKRSSMMEFCKIHFEESFPIDLNL